jgi:hypothetical protein
MPKYFEVSGPAFVGLLVRDVKASAEFHEKKLGFRRDPAVFPTSVGFLTYPFPFGLIQASPGVDLDSIPRPITTPAVRTMV